MNVTALPNIKNVITFLPLKNVYLLHSKWISLFMVQVFLEVKEGVEEDMGHSATLQVTQRDPPYR